VTHGTFTCSLCAETYEKARSDDEAMEESQEIFGEYGAEDLAAVCDPCWREMMGLPPVEDAS
jgi:hypothetical protein